MTKDTLQEAIQTTQNAINLVQDQLEMGNRHIQQLNHTLQDIKAQLQLLTTLAQEKTEIALNENNADISNSGITQPANRTPAIDQVLHDEVVNTLLPLIKTELQTLPYVTTTLAQSIIDACSSLEFTAYLDLCINDYDVSATMAIDNLDNILYHDYAKQNPQNTEAINRYEADMRALEIEEVIQRLLDQLIGVQIHNHVHSDRPAMAPMIKALYQHPDLREAYDATITVHLHSQP